MIVEVPLDVFSSLRSTALVTLVAASFSSPIVLRSDAVANVTDRLQGKDGGHETQAAPEQVLAGGVEFEKPATWDALGASATEITKDTETVGTVVAGLCPGGSSGATCTDGTRLTFIAYSGKDGHDLPLLTTLREQLDAQLAGEFPGFTAGEATSLPGADGIRYLDYSFTWGAEGKRASQRIGAYRHADGSGVVVTATGPKLEHHRSAIGSFFASAREPLDEAH